MGWHVFRLPYPYTKHLLSVWGTWHGRKAGTWARCNFHGTNRAGNHYTKLLGGSLGHCWLHWVLATCWYGIPIPVRCQLLVVHRHGQVIIHGCLNVTIIGKFVNWACRKWQWSWTIFCAFLFGMWWSHGRFPTQYWKCTIWTWFSPLPCGLPLGCHCSWFLEVEATQCNLLDICTWWHVFHVPVEIQHSHRAATRKKHWNHWKHFASPFGAMHTYWMASILQDTHHD